MIKQFLFHLLGGDGVLQKQVALLFAVGLQVVENLNALARQYGVPPLE